MIWTTFSPSPVVDIKEIGMVRKKKREAIIIFLLLFYGVLINLSAADYYELPMSGISPLLTGIGGEHPAYTDGFATIYTNPAGFFASGEEVSWAELSFGLKGPIFSITDAILTGDETALAELIIGAYSGLALGGPLSFGYVGNGLGLAAVATSDVLISSDSIFVADALVRQDLLLTGGYSFPVNIMPDGHSLEGGVLLKGGFRGELDASMPTTQLLGMDFVSLMDSEPFAFITLIGMDLGLLYSWKDRVFVGLTGKDVYTPTSKKNYSSFNYFLAGNDPDAANPQEYGLVPFTLNLGGRYLMDLAERNIFISEVNFYLSYEDMLDFWLYPRLATNPVLHIALGAEVTMLRILDVRLGMAQGLPAAGLGIDLNWFTMNASMFGTERSTEPGMSPVYNLQLGFEFRY
jgi:hypothetical protein